MLTSNKNRVDRFTNSLALALYDKKIELQGHPLLFFLDADVVLKLVMGFEADHIDNSGDRSRQKIVRSLFSIGYLGNFFLLRPHAFEFYEKLKVRPKYQSIDTKEQFRQRAQAYIEKTGIHEIMEQLHRVINSNEAIPSENKDKQIKKFLSILSQKSAETFSSIEQLNGTWSQRLRKLFDSGRIKLDYLGPETSELVADYNALLFEFNKHIIEKRKLLTVNAFQDATAFTILHKYIADQKEGKVEHMVRFYTETAALNELLQTNSNIQNLLTYENPIIDVNQYLERCNLIYRDSDYFIMRALFKELAPKNSIKIDDLEWLDELYHQFKSLMEEDEVDIERILKTVTVQEKNLIDVLDNFEKISIMEPLWVKGGVPNVLKEMNDLSGWTKIFHFAQGNRTGIILQAQIDDIRKNLDNHVSKLRNWTRDFKSIIKARNERAQYLERIENPMRDLGLIRWNYNIDKEGEKKILDTLRDLSEEENEPLTASTLANSMESARKSVEDCHYVCAILWALGRYKEISFIVEQCRINNPGKFPSSLYMIRLAAKMRAGEVTTEKDRKYILRKVSQHLSLFSQDERKGALLGAGYIYYHAWRQAMVKATAKERLWENQPENIRLLAQKAFDLGEEAYNTFEVHSLEWAFAVNHCAYIQIATNKKSKKNEKSYLEILLRLQMFESLWCARFDDTVGYYYLVSAEKKWALASDDEKKSIDLSTNIKNAEAFFSSAKNRDTGDIDIDEHVARLNLLIDSFEEFRKLQT